MLGGDGPGDGSAPGVGSMGGKLLLGDSQLDGGRPTQRLASWTAPVISFSEAGESSTGDTASWMWASMTRQRRSSVSCGAAVLFRRAMLEEVQIDGEYFDEDFFAYKEDVDICWRAQLLGWSSFYNPAAIAYHLRGWKRRDDRRRVPWLRKYHSFKNHYLMMIKNEIPALFWRDFFPILWLGVRAIVYISVMEPPSGDRWWISGNTGPGPAISVGSS